MLLSVNCMEWQLCVLIKNIFISNYVFICKITVCKNQFLHIGLCVVGGVSVYSRSENKLLL